MVAAARSWRLYLEARAVTPARTRGAGEQRRAVEDGLVAQRRAHAVSCVSGGAWAVVGAVDPEAAGIDPLRYM